MGKLRAVEFGLSMTIAGGLVGLAGTEALPAEHHFEQMRNAVEMCIPDLPALTTTVITELSGDCRTYARDMRISMADDAPESVLSTRQDFKAEQSTNIIGLERDKKVFKWLLPGSLALSGLAIATTIISSRRMRQSPRQDDNWLLLE